MFDTILNLEMSHMGAVMICMATALLLGFLLAFVYMLTDEKYSKNMAVTLILLAPIVTAIISVVNGNLGTGIAILGVFALVRFRSKPGTSKDILYVLFDMTIGVTAASGYIFYTALITVILAAILVVLKLLKFGERSDRVKTLRVTIPEDLDYESVFNDIFDKYMEQWSLVRVKTTNLGSLFDLQYEVTLKKGIHEKEMLDEIRVRNGNLTVMLARRLEIPEEL